MKSLQTPHLDKINAAINNSKTPQDSKKILNQSKKKNILTPWLRPKYLSQKTSKSSDSALHAINWYENYIGKLDGVLLLQPTTPYRNLRDLISALNIFVKNNGKKKVISVSPIKKHHTHIYVNKNNSLVKIFSGNPKILTKELYVTNGSFYIISTNYLKAKKNFDAINAIPYVIKSKIFSLDIDDIFDFQLAKVISTEFD